MLLRLLILALLFTALAARAETPEGQDGTLMQRLTRPNTSLTYNTGQSTLGKTAPLAKSQSVTKEFGGSRSFLSKEYTAKAYGGTEKRSWFASLFFPAKSAATKGKYEIPNAGEAYGTKTSPTKDAPGATKGMDTSAYAQTDLRYLKRNRFDTSIKSAPPQGGKGVLGYTGDLQPMTIDDVRTLLNKNK